MPADPRDELVQQLNDAGVLAIATDGVLALHFASGRSFRIYDAQRVLETTLHPTTRKQTA